jgi:hypothetical protein
MSVDATDSALEPILAEALNITQFERGEHPGSG